MNLGPQSPTEPSIVPTTDRIAEECPRFRILIIGRSGMGKSSLINAIFKASLAEVQHDKAGYAEIDNGITSPQNKHLILHDSQGYEPGDVEKFGLLEKFITERSQREPAERLHAIWLCITAPFSRGRIFETGEEKIFNLNRNKVPIIVVFTKFDLFVASLSRRNAGRGKISLDVAETRFKNEHGQAFERATQNITGRIPYTTVAISMSDTLQRLVEITMQSIVDSSNSSSRLTRGLDDDLSDSAQIALATAQRVDMPAKIVASTKVGEKKYWSAIGSGIGFFGFSLQKCLYAIHKDIVTVWNIRDLDEYFLSDDFFSRMAVIVGDLSHGSKCASPTRRKIAMGSASILNGLTGVYRKLPEHIHFLMGYVVDLTLILQAVFQVSLQDRTEGKVTKDRVTEIIYEFHLSEKKKSIHDSIVGAEHLVAKDSMVEQIKSLIKENQMTASDRQLDQTRPIIPLLLSILKFEQSTNGLVVNPIILDLLHKVLDLQDYGTIVGELKDPANDVELLIDFVLYALRNDALLGSSIPDANRRARRLMFKLINKTDVSLKFLFITDVKILSYHDSGGFGRVYKGEHKGQQVAMKVLDKEGTRKKDFCREALAWRSLAHKFILPLVGIFEEKAQQFLVSPLMTNGTLTQWRKNQPQPLVVDIHRLMLEVAEGVQYIHSEGIVHGDLRGENVLIDSNLHCQIADFGLTRHLDATVTKVASSMSLNFAAPELFGICDKCGGSGCEECCEDHDSSKTKRKTKETDIYAFGCLYYTIFFDTFPFHGRDEYQILRLVTSGTRPERLKSPMIEDEVWDVIQSSWKPRPSERSTMEQIVKSLKALTQGQS